MTNEPLSLWKSFFKDSLVIYIRRKLGEYFLLFLLILGIRRRHKIF